MHRSITALIAAGLLLLAMAIPASAAKPDATGPACADIDISGNYFTDPDTGQATATFNFELPLVACERLVYSVFVYDETGEVLLETDSITGTAGPIGFALEVPGSPEWVCLSATSSTAQGKVFDAGPDVGCVLFELDAGGGLSKFG